MSKRSLREGSIGMSSSKRDEEDINLEKIMYKEAKLTRMVKAELERRASLVGSPVPYL